MNPNKINPFEAAPDNQQTGWEIVEAEAGKMNAEVEKKPTPEEVNTTCERVLGRTADDTGRELQLLDFIDGYRTMEYKDPEKHRELLEIAAAGTAIGREDTDYEDGAMKGLKHTITAIMPDGSRVTEERIYSTLEPKLKEDKIAEYLENGVIDSSDVGVIEVIHGLLEGQGKDLEQTEASQIREQGGKIKEKVMHHYNEMYKSELFQDDGVDREGLKHLELDNGQKVLLFSGAEFKMLAHVRFAMEMSMGKRTTEDLMQRDPKDDWSSPHKGSDGREIAPPHALSTSLISNDKIHIYKPSEIIYGFNEFEGDGIITMGTEDIASYSNGNSKYSVRSARFNERMMSPDELISETGARREENGETYNEVVLDRYSGKDGGIIQPSCLIAFGKDESVITPLQLKHAEAFKVPIYVVDSEKYGGVKTILGGKAVPNNDESSAETAKNGEIDPKIISKIDECMMSSSENPYMMARYVADLAGVAAGIKPTALIQTMDTELNIDNAMLADLIKQSGLCIADGWEDGKYFVSKDINLANQVKEKFHKLWNRTITDSEDCDLGRLLGYPETAVAQDFKKHKRTLEKIRKVFAKDSLERYYTHSPEHKDEEFESYEKPIHEYMEEYCPRATALLKDERSSHGKKYRWL